MATITLADRLRGDKNRRDYNSVYQHTAMERGAVCKAQPLLKVNPTEQVAFHMSDRKLLLNELLAVALFGSLCYLRLVY